MVDAIAHSQLIAKHLFKAYKKRAVVHDFSINVESGQIVGLLGPNGAGKTTSFYMMVGLIKADKGNIILDDIDITRRTMAYRSRAGLSYLPQEASIFRKLTVYENIMGILEIQPKLKRNIRRERCEQLITQFNLANVRNSLGHQLSGGERRRVEIARALATNPKFILLDEPFAGVDPISVDEIKSVIKTLSQANIGILITDHNVRETLSICHHATIMNQGEILAQGDPTLLLNHSEVRKIYLGQNFTM